MAKLESVSGVLYMPVFRIDGRTSQVTQRRNIWALVLRDKIITVYKPDSVRIINELAKIKEAKLRILQLLEKAGGKVEIKEIREIPYQKYALRELEQERQLERKESFYLLTESGKQEIQKVLREIQEKKLKKQKLEQERNEQKQLQVDNALQIFSEAVVKSDGIFPLADISNLFSKNQAKIIRDHAPSIEIPSHSLESKYLTWFFTGDKKIALPKIRAKVSLLAIERWKNFCLEVGKRFNIQLEINLNDPKISVAGIKKAVSQYVVSFHKISKDLGESPGTLERMIKDLQLSSVENPEGNRLFHKEDFYNNQKKIQNYYLVTTTHIACYLGITLATVRKRLKKHEVTPYVAQSYQSYLYLWKDAQCAFPEPIPKASEVIEFFKEHREKFFQEQQKKEQEKIQKEQEKLLLLRDKVLAMFPIKSREEQLPKVFFHVGPTNSGKTHGAIQHLKQADCGIYLAPLRLLAWKVFEKLNQESVICSLLTGEEVITHEKSRFISATVEMFPVENFWDVVILDEAQMISNSQRGWAWTKVLAHVRTQELHICCAPEAEKLLRDFLTKLGYETIHTTSYERLCPLKVATKSWSLEKCLTLVNAPVTKETKGYWLRCVDSIVEEETLPPPNFYISKDEQLQISELAELEYNVNKCEIYLWLSNRKAFQHFASTEEKESVFQNKKLAAAKIDTILHKIILGWVKKCKKCGMQLPPLYPHGICSHCYNERNFNRWEDDLCFLGSSD